jgi:hypothetical protein
MVNISLHCCIQRTVTNMTFLCLVFGVRVAKFDVSVNGVVVEMIPVLVYTN